MHISVNEGLEFKLPALQKESHCHLLLRLRLRGAIRDVRNFLKSPHMFLISGLMWFRPGPRAEVALGAPCLPTLNS